MRDLADSFWSFIPYGISVAFFFHWLVAFGFASPCLCQVAFVRLAFWRVRNKEYMTSIACSC